MGNIGSVNRALHKIGVDVLVSSSESDIRNAEKIVMPGVGRFDAAMRAMERAKIVAPLKEAVLGRKTPILGICLGMEVFARTSEEGNVHGLGWIDARVKRFAPGDRSQFKVPHMGWNTVISKNGSTLLRGLGESDEFYFAHSYYLDTADDAAVAGTTSYDITFDSVIESENIFGVQFHPEKSHDAGLKILGNFINI
jgi:glutamine amidotransferase